MSKAGSGYLGAAGLFFLIGAVGVGAYLTQSDSGEAAKEEAATNAGAVLSPASKVDPATSQGPAAALEGSLEISFAGTRESIERKALGGNRSSIEAALMPIKSRLDHGAANAYLDLEAREVHAAKDGLAIDLFGAVSAVQFALRTGAKTVELEGVPVPAERTIADLGVSDISAIVGSFKTKFSVAEKTRNANLKLLASKVNGYVLKPGEEFSFNALTGDRLLEDGFKMAHVISQGQMVDGMAGGSCQISTTLHGAAFFSGLEILKVTPHSRPSTYVTLGLDATVVASRVDLKLRNPYDFPVVIHYQVARGVSHVEILGKEKPFDEIEFERSIDERIDFETVTREDPTMGMGHMVVEQLGYPGYKVSKIRRIYKDGEVIKTDKWKLRYQPVIEYARLGINPNPNLPAPRKRKGHGPKPASGRFTMRQ
ncbi:MAG: hypothetical protein GY811_02185 [Myxococcales bacterium]|nr:hypothetical protein [Myxococcales bacterium]